VEALIGPGSENWLGPLHRERVAAHQHDCFAPANLLAGTDDRRIDVPNAATLQIRSQAGGVIGIPRRGINQQRIRFQSGELLDDRCHDA
jgi:hypothetical protein